VWREHIYQTHHTQTHSASTQEVTPRQKTVFEADWVAGLLH
jgi:hypothetical protein